MSEAPERIWLIETDKYNPYRVSCSTAPHSPDESTEYVRADRIEALERENAALRDDDAKMQLLHRQEDQLIAAERKVKALEREVAESRRRNEEMDREIDGLRNSYWEERKAHLAASADKARLSEALRPFADMADYLDSETEGFADTDEFDLLYEDHLFHHFKVADFRDARAALSGSNSGWRECATEGCAHAATVRCARDGVESEYCHACYMRIQALPAAPQQGGE